MFAYQFASSDNNNIYTSIINMQITYYSMLFASHIRYILAYSHYRKEPQIEY
jgi:hypothetical protein